MMFVLLNLIYIIFINIIKPNFCIIIEKSKIIIIGDWGLGIGDWGL